MRSRIWELLLFVDLPNLTEITSEGNSFANQHRVELQSIYDRKLLYRYSKCKYCRTAFFFYLNEIINNREYDLNTVSLR